MCFVHCTTLSSFEECALIGQVQTGTTIGTSTHIGSTIDGSIYSYNRPSYNPTCKIPTTEEEQKTLSEILPQAIQKEEQRIAERWAILGASLVFGVLVVLLKPQKQEDI